VCTLALFAFVIAAVLISRRLAQLIGVAALVLIALAVVALAEERRPLPVPQVGAGCPSGYTSSPTSGTCVPRPSRGALVDRGRTGGEADKVATTDKELA
jgi:hypothetical protein